VLPGPFLGQAIHMSKNTAELRLCFFIPPADVLFLRLIELQSKGQAILLTPHAARLPQQNGGFTD